MRLAIGDVVRDRTDMALGTVAGFAGHGSTTSIVLQLSGGELRSTRAHELELVGRSVRETTPGLALLTWSVICVATILALLGINAETSLGADWILCLTTGLGCFWGVLWVFLGLLKINQPRRTRV